MYHGIEDLFHDRPLPSFSKDGWLTPNSRFQMALGEAYCIACKYGNII